MQKALVWGENLIRRGQEIWRHEGFQKYFQNTGWMFGGRMFSLVISFFVGIYIARYLGPTNYGTLSYVISFVGLFAFLVSFGIDGILNREIIKDHSKKDSLIGTAFYLKILGSLLAIFFVFIASLFTTKDIFILGLIWIFSLNFIPQAFNVIETYFQSQVLAKNVVKAQIFSSLIAVILKILVIVLNKGIFWLTLIFVFETIIYGLFLLYAFRRYGNHIRDWKFDKNVALNLLKDSWPLMFSSLAIGIYMKIDQVMIQNMLGSEQVGLYAVAVKLSEVWYFIPMLITSSLFPALVNAKKMGDGFFNKRMSKLYFFMFWMSFGIAIVTTLLAKPIISILFGSAYLNSIPVLQIYVWAGIAVFLGYASAQYLIIKNLSKIFFINTLLGSFINIALNFFLIPQIGIIGAGVATLISYTIATFAIVLFKETKRQGILIISSIINTK